MFMRTQFLFAFLLLLVQNNFVFAQDLPGFRSETIDGAGVKLHAVVGGEGPLLILLHGFPDYWYTWRAQMPELAKTHKVVAFDLRGYNESDKPDGVENYAMQKLVSDVLAVADHFKSEKFTLIGHDWGGAIAWSVAMSKPDRVERLVILNLPHPRGLMRELANNPEQQKASQYAVNFQQEGAEKSLPAEALVFWVKDPEAREHYLQAFRKSSTAAMLSYYKANYPRPPYERSVFGEMPTVKCPTLVIHGLADTALLPGALNDTWNWVEGELTLVTIPKAGHFVQQDAPRRVTQIVSNWLASEIPMR
jgi:pimeloyl-ACP methyl ester carboxylesterase